MMLLDKLNAHRQQKTPAWVVFFDLVSAYDRVDRRILRDRLREYRVLDDTQIQLWEWLATNLQVQLGDQAVATTNGIPQGSTLAPIMWNVYMMSLMITLTTKFNQERVSPDQVADDLAAVTTSWYLCR